jgi:hypothetical protein
VEQVGQFVQDHVVQDETRHSGQAPGDPDLTRSGSARAPTGVLVGNPANLIAQTTIKPSAVDLLGPAAQVCLGVLGSGIHPAQDLLLHLGDPVLLLAGGEPCGEADLQHVPGERGRDGLAAAGTADDLDLHATGFDFRACFPSFLALKGSGGVSREAGTIKARTRPVGQVSSGRLVEAMPSCLLAGWLPSS